MKVDDELRDPPDAEIKAAYPETPAIEIESCVHSSEIPVAQFEEPYYLETLPRARKLIMLRERCWLGSGRLARVVLHTKEYLAALIPADAGLMLITLRWANEIRAWKDIKLPPGGRKALKESDLKMAKQLIADMTGKWKPDAYTDKFTPAIHALVAKRQGRPQNPWAWRIAASPQCAGSDGLAHRAEEESAARRSLRSPAERA